jgi:hypothetical protein
MEEIKKSYNPFKMWGSWVGAIIFLFLAVYSMHASLNIKYFVRLLLFQEHYYYDTGFLSSIITYLITGTGFLIGWGIHSLLRKFNK